MTILLELREILISLNRSESVIWGSGNSEFNVKELVPELQNDNTPRAQGNTHIT